MSKEQDHQDPKEPVQQGASVDEAGGVGLTGFLVSDVKESSGERHVSGRGDKILQSKVLQCFTRFC